MRARLRGEVVVEESEIAGEHNQHARVPTEHVRECSRRRNLNIPNKNEEYESQAIQPICSGQDAICVRPGKTCFLPSST